MRGLMLGQRTPRGGLFEWQWTRNESPPADYMALREKAKCGENVTAHFDAVGDLKFWICSIREEYDAGSTLFTARVQIRESFS